MHISEVSEANEDIARSVDKEAKKKTIRHQDSFNISVDGNEISVGSKQHRLKSSARTFKDIKDPSFAQSVAELSTEVDRLLAQNPSTKRLRPETCDKEVQIEGATFNQRDVEQVSEFSSKKIHTVRDLKKAGLFQSPAVFRDSNRVNDPTDTKIHKGQSLLGANLRAAYGQVSQGHLLKKKMNKRAQSQSFMHAITKDLYPGSSVQNSNKKQVEPSNTKDQNFVNSFGQANRNTSVKAFEKKAETLKLLLQKCQNDLRDSIIRHSHKNEGGDHHENCPKCLRREQKLNEVPFLEVYKAPTQGINCPTDLEDIQKRFLLTQKLVRAKEYDSNRKITSFKEKQESKLNQTLSKAITKSLGQMQLDKLLQEIDRPEKLRDIKISDGNSSKVDTSYQSELRDFNQEHSGIEIENERLEKTDSGFQQIPSRKVRNYVRGILSKSRSLRESHSNSKMPDFSKSASKDFLTKFKPQKSKYSKNTFLKVNGAEVAAMLTKNVGKDKQGLFFFNSSTKAETKD